MAAITPVVMPKWGLSMTVGTVNAWLVDEGARIAVGDPILAVETDKISGEVEAADPGLLRRKVASPGQTLPVKALLGVMAEADVSDQDIDAFIAAYVVPAAEAEAAAAESAYRFSDVDGIRVRHARRGDGAATVLFLHGFGGDLDTWLFNLEALADLHTAIALDLPGHGQSDRKLPGKTLAELARFAVHFLDAVEVSAAHLVGHSMGGAIAAQMALDHPQRVASVALIGSAGLGDEINTGYTEGFIAAQSRRDLKPVVEQLFAKPELVTRRLLDDLLKYKRLDGVTALLTELNDSLFGQGRQREQPARRLGDAGKPVLVVWGAEDRIIPPLHARRAGASAAVAVIEGAGHMVQMEKAGEVNNLLKRHLAP
jgi:pyruvate dehydrogenase E2 component (dihydrolipoamide acetyltransferase)